MSHSPEGAANPSRARHHLPYRLLQVDEEVRSLLGFLESNPYAALKLPLPRGAGEKRVGSWAGEVTDASVKSNYRKLALRFHPGKRTETSCSYNFQEALGLRERKREAEKDRERARERERTLHRRAAEIF